MITSVWCAAPNNRWSLLLGMYFNVFIYYFPSESIIISDIFSASHPKSGRVLEVYSNQPGVQLYTGNFMPDPNNQVIYNHKHI